MLKQPFVVLAGLLLFVFISGKRLLRLHLLCTVCTLELYSMHVPTYSSDIGYKEYKLAGKVRPNTVHCGYSIALVLCVGDCITMVVDKLEVREVLVSGVC